MRVIAGGELDQRVKHGLALLRRNCALPARFSRRRSVLLQPTRAIPGAGSPAALDLRGQARAQMPRRMHEMLDRGIGFTWDNDTHLWFKRAKTSEVLLGDAN
jgi:hypothetical protein